jgi:low affinity Fe/Cu permease
MTTKEHLDKHDRQIAAIRALLQEGMRLMVETRKDLRAVAAIEKRTEAKLEALIDSLKGGGNGHAKRRLDIE